MQGPEFRRWRTVIPGPASPSVLSFTLLAWAGWRDRPEGAEEAGGGEAAGPVPVLLRRRVPREGQAMLRLAWRLAAAEGARIVASSRHGAFSRSLAIMRAVRAGEPASPAEFSLSVHHALAGLLSIARRNRAGHTAVAAGEASLAAGLIEAAAGLAGAGALLMHLEEALPAPFDAALPPAPPACALVLALAPSGAQRGERMEIALDPSPRLAGRLAGSGDDAEALWAFLAAPGRAEVALGSGRLALRLRRVR